MTRLSWWLILLISACRSGDTEVAGPTDFLLPVAEIRFQETGDQLRAILRLNRGDSLAVATLYEPDENRPPLFMGSPMFKRSGDGRWAESRQLEWPGELRFAIPAPAEAAEDERRDLRINMTPPFADSLPVSIDLSRGTRFAFANEPLLENESLLIFFETRDWSPGVKRILLAGPTRDNFARLPPETLRELPPGNYELYLVKQKLSRDTLPGLRSSTQIEYFSRSGQVEVF